MPFSAPSAFRGFWGELYSTPTRTPAPFHPLKHWVVSWVVPDPVTSPQELFSPGNFGPMVELGTCGDEEHERHIKYDRFIRNVGEGAVQYSCPGCL